MVEALVFLGVFGGFFIIRLVAATLFFYFIIPAGDRCIMCDAPTLRVQNKGWNRVAPWLRTSWCMECGWEGLLRHGPLTEPPRTGSVPPPPPAQKSRSRRSPLS